MSIQSNLTPPARGSEPPIASGKPEASPAVGYARWPDARPARNLLELLGTPGLVRFLVLGGATAFFFWDQLVRLYRICSSNPDWSHGLLIPFFSLYFIHTKRQVLARTPVRRNWFGLLILVAAIVGYFICVRARIGSPQALMIVVAITGLTLLCCGWQVLKICAFPIGFLALGMPPPEYLYREFTQPLQKVAAFCAEQALGQFPNVLIQRSGINIAFDHLTTGRTGTFTVAGACSGMRSLMAFVALGLAMAYFSPRPMWHRVLIAVSVIPVAVFCNVVRVIATGSFQIYGLGDLAKGTPHAMTGIATFALGFVIFYGIMWVMDHLFVEESAEGAAEAKS